MGALKNVMFSVEHVGMGAYLSDIVVNLLSGGVCGVFLWGTVLVKCSFVEVGLFF